ncbi:MAG: nucleotidyltransferase family protein, partial [Negativicutes bacterium]|nr:nucleotidyltransferase family protein [Negativicutes bacterium]
MKTGAVIVAAGLSSRMKSFKPMLQLGGSTVIKTAIETLKAAGVDPIVVVTGLEAERLQHHLAPLNVTCLYNPDYRTTDMFFSACLGMQWIQERCERFFFLPADVPLFAKRSLLTMMGLMDYSHCAVLLPSHKGRSGHPVLLQNGIISDLLQSKGDGGLGAALSSLTCSKETIELPDLGMTLDADRPEDYQRLKQYAAAMSQTNPVTCSVQLSLSRREVFFQDDTAVLLEKVALAGSLSAACKLLSISYSSG